MTSEPISGLPGRVPGAEERAGNNDVARDDAGNVQTASAVSTSGTNYTTADVPVDVVSDTIAGRVYATAQTLRVTGLGTNTATIEIYRNGNIVTSASGTGSVTAFTSAYVLNGTHSPSVVHRIAGLNGGTATVGTANAEREERYAAHG